MNIFEDMNEDVAVKLICTAVIIAVLIIGYIIGSSGNSVDSLCYSMVENKQGVYLLDQCDGDYESVSVVKK